MFISSRLSSRKLVLQTLEFESPPRIPRQLKATQEIQRIFGDEILLLQKDYPDDLVFAPAVYHDHRVATPEHEKEKIYVDEWGCVFERVDDFSLGKVKKPIIKDWAEETRFRPPEALLKIDKDEINAFCRQTDCFILAGYTLRLFERLQFLRGEENALIDLAQKPKGLFSLLNKIHEHNLKIIDVWSTTSIDALVIVDDWGSQQRLLVSPSLWREMFKPRYAEYADFARLRNKKVFFHSDGFILDIIPDLMDIGVDALNVQLFTIGLESLARFARGKISFWGDADAHYLRQETSQLEMGRVVEAIKQNLYDRGGVIAYVDFNSEVLPKSVRNFFQEWERICSS